VTGGVEGILLKQTNLEHSKRFTQTTRGKLILAFGLVLCVSLFTWIVNRSAFDRINTVVEDLAKPNNRLNALNDLQMEMSRLNDFYRAEALQNRYNPSGEYDKRVAQISNRLTQLKDSFADNSTQVERLVQVDSIFARRNKLFEKYLKIRYNYIHNGLVDKQFEELADQVDKENLKVDTNVVTTEKQTKTYTYFDPVVKEEVPAKKRRFRRKKQVVVETKPYVVVEEKMNIHIDTLAVSQKKDSILENIRISLDQVESERNSGRKFLQKQELILIKSNEILYNRLLEIIGEVKNEESMNTHLSSAMSIQIARETVSFTKILTVVFVLVAFVLIGFIIGDISKFNRYRRQLEASREEAEFHSQAKQRFLSNMSHEIRSPLQTIVGYSELLMNEPGHDKSKIEVVSKASEHLLQVVNEILDYSRIISSSFKIEKKPFQLKGMIDEVADLSAFQCSQKGIQWIFLAEGLEEMNATVVSDSFRLKQILINIISNAVKFTQQGSVSLKVQMNDHANNLEVFFTISDTGIGMDAKDLKLVFQQFEQARNAPVQSGTGLGLSIVKELVDALKGKMNVKSALGKGTEFKLHFSFEKAQASELQTAVNKLEESIELDGEIWVVDDDPLILKLCEQLLKQKNLKFRCFSDPGELLDADWNEDVKVIYADVRMPGISGIDLCARLRQRGHKQVKIIALTAQVLPEEKELFLQSGFDEIVLKPFKSNEFYEPIRKLNMRETEFDFSGLKAMVPDEGDFKEIRIQFVSDSKSDLKAIKTALGEQNAQDILLLVHRLAGRFGQMGSRNLAQKLRMLEIQLKNSGRGVVFYEVNEIIPELEKGLIMNIFGQFE
jgi:signal transduction histidine kinase/DNA-binding response OmpR family regulator